MPVAFTLPDLGEGLVDAEIVRWLVTVGDDVRADQPLVEVETAKATVEIPSPAAGTVLRLGGGAGDVLAVGALLVELTGDDAAPRRRVLASPSTRARATALGLDLATIVGSEIGGRITRDDVERAARRQAAAQASTGPGAASPSDRDIPQGRGRPTAVRAPESGRTDVGDREVPLRGIRREVARAMTESWQQIPHVTEFREVDAGELVRAHRLLRDSWPEDRPRLSLLPLLALASVAALRAHPVLNASLDMRSETVRYHGAVHLGIATATADGLTVPVVRDADRMGLPELAAHIAAAVDAARARRARPDQFTGGTCTLSNFGSYGTWLGTPVINPPQAAIVGFGRVRDAVVAVDGEAVVRPTLPMAVSADHRLIDGDVLGAFVADLASVLSDPVLLLGRA